MFCPKCRSEYSEGFTTCADCGAELVEELSKEAEFEYVEFTTIAETRNLGLIALAKSILDSEGIKYYINDVPTLIAAGTIFAQIQVPISDAENAKELLKDIGL
ncbi:putative signal transducing protein [Candidatus Clostridium stratigraminis]|uniref:Signal transducing protein n=1 Tax=Candidatus Clostridium stratigraminis TaxID=3381661 RepID=A0ABW8T4P2_9CLOT